MNRPLLTPRSALIFLLGILCGIGAGVLTGLAGLGVVQGVLTGTAAAGVAVSYFSGLID